MRDLDAHGDEGAEAGSSGNDRLRGVDGVEASVLHESAAGAEADELLREPAGLDRGAEAGEPQEAGRGSAEVGYSATPSGLDQPSEAIEATTRSRRKRNSRRDGIADFAGENCLATLAERAGGT